MTKTFGHENTYHQTNHSGNNAPMYKTISERNPAQGKKRDKNESNRNQKNTTERDVPFPPTFFEK